MRRTLALGLAAASVVALPVAPAYAQDVRCSEIGADTVPAPETSATSTPLELLHVRRAHELLDRRGRGEQRPVGVAVVDSGVRTGWHAAAVAGLVAGQARAGDRPVGVAPRARIVDVPVWNDQDPDSRPTSRAVAQGLQRVAERARADNIRVATVALEVAGSPALRRAVADATRAGVLVVAAAGDRVTAAGLDDDFEEFRAGAGEDAHRTVFPAGYGDALAVSAVTAGMPGGGDARQWVVQNSQTDLAAPTHGAVSTGLKGTCVLTDGVSSHWAAAEVSGVAALLWAAYPADSVAQIRSRLLESASGRTDATTVTTGAGVVQPLEALTRPMAPRASGAIPRPQEQVTPDPPAAAPPAPEDLLAPMRTTALWWGLGGGIAIVVVLLLRPLRRRR